MRLLISSDVNTPLVACANKIINSTATTIQPPVGLCPSDSDDLPEREANIYRKFYLGDLTK